jgi:cytochrome c553
MPKNRDWEKRAKNNEIRKKVMSLPLLTALLVASVTALQAAALTQGEDVFVKSVQPILNEFCITCHSTEKQKGDLDLG